MSRANLHPIEPSPDALHPLAREILEGLRDHPEAASLILGGGVALQHYCPYRSTRDLDAWWAAGADPKTEKLLREVMTGVATRHGLSLGVRSWGETQSYELEKAGAKVFSFQVAVRDIQLEKPLVSTWSPVRIETFPDNLASKMNALVGRGAPRDFMDVHEVCRRGLAAAEECWQLWSRKNPGKSREEARASVLRHLEHIELRRPPSSIPNDAERTRAERLRHWVRGELCAASG